MADEKRKTDTAPWFSRRKIILAMVVLVICGVIGYIGVRMYQSLEMLRNDMTHITTGAQAGGTISHIMGTPLPATTRNMEHRTFGYMDYINETLKFSLPPDDYAAFIAAASPVEQYSQCLMFPLLPEGKQPQKPDCYGGGMTISIDKSNPALWRIEIDITRSV